MPGPSAVRIGKPQAANAAHDVTESSLHAMLDVPEAAIHLIHPATAGARIMRVIRPTRTSSYAAASPT
ncbi:hypothetical protein O164_12245 [Pseudomonas taiwanensis SJ9]|uniref:Uncharacterized protein n=1 Tax=Pseudomonas taiwanensis SJ9 TaxID=1388762 RepID=V7DCI6_9PSED|nr:hypothetical protein O164_12245 [Pseudomonas taiwanensis SJ9]